MTFDRPPRPKHRQAALVALLSAAAMLAMLMAASVARSLGN